ncbi:glycosyltransferase [Nocardia suismassiliense]|uniref:glycosyltransferase n=1 Tax=Nocardia suismassiliense TaxID=2077092 RepID=UPI000D1DC50F|nr:glycosyltransferase [Nocardia suismassiliense]
MSTERLSIALLASNRHPIRQPFAGGLEAHVWHLARALQSRGHRVTLFAADGSDSDAADAILRVRAFSPSTTASTDSSMPPRQFLADHHAYLTVMTDLSATAPTSFDVVHNHSLHYLPVAMAPVLGVPMLTTLHTPPTPWLESALDVSKGIGSAFVAVSRYTAQSWDHVVRGVDVVPNGINLSAWPAGPGGADLVWFGRLTPEKGAHLAIEAARRTGRRLHLAGPVSDAQYFRESIEPRLGRETVYHGHLDQAALARLVGSCAAALVTPLWDEPYGLVVAEALACGTPVAAFARGGIPEIVDSDCGRLVTPGDVDALADGAAQAVTLSRTHARGRAETSCGLDAMVEAYLERYHQLIATSSTEAHRGAA